ncbi:MAG: PP2C family protein-serine/threonine phosphatase [Phycisphaerales bacterium]
MARRLPRRSNSFVSSRAAAQLYAGVFLLFAPIGLLIAMCQTEPWGWAAGLYSAAFAGCIALGWVYAINRRRYWLIAPLILVPSFAAPLFFRPAQWVGLYQIGADYPRAVRMIILALLVAACISVGFVLVIRYVQSTESKAAKDRAELDVAQKIHDTLVPAIDLEWGRARVIARSTASERMGGDLVDAFVRDDQLDLVIADVSGHGVGAGVVMAMVKSALRARLDDDHQTPLPDLLAGVSRVVCSSVSYGMFVTMTCVRLRTSGECEVAMAGHLPTLIRRDDGAIESLDNESLPIGVRADEEFVSVNTRLGAGDRLALYTDGLTETADERDRFFGIDGMRNALAATGRSDLETAFYAVLAAVRDHGPTRDDQSLLLVEVGSA